MNRTKIASVDNDLIVAAGESVTGVALVAARISPTGDHRQMVAEIRSLLETGMEQTQGADFPSAVQSYGNAASRLILVVAGLEALSRGLEEAVN